MEDAHAELPGADAEPLDAVEQARWDAVTAHAGDLAEAVAQGDDEGFSAAFEALGQARVDLTGVLNALHIPADAGEWAPALERILRRIPEQWGRWISCGPGWYPLLARLDERLTDIDPWYVVLQVKEKFGGLRYYVEPSPPVER